MAGFEFYETMAGSFRLQGEPEDRAMSFTIRARSRPLLAFLRRREVEIEGEVDAEGFADHRHCRGMLGLDPLLTRTLPYAFRFTANDGASYTFEGKKTLRVGRLAESMTVLPGLILDAAGKQVGEALLRFDLRSDLARFLRSWHLA
jgi:hypothetical protein